jgi:hypothetical protein
MILICFFSRCTSLYYAECVFIFKSIFSFVQATTSSLINSSPMDTTSSSHQHHNNPHSEHHLHHPSTATTVLVSNNQNTADHGDSEMPPHKKYKTTHHTSPIPERKTYSRENEEVRLESKIQNCPPQAYKFYMEQHIENVIKSSEDRRKRRMQLEKEMLK